MNKRILSLVLAFVLLLGSFATVQAAEEAKENNASQDAKIQWLVDNKIVVGKNVNKDGSADLALEDNVTRAEITKLIVYTLKLEKLADALKGVMKPFPDVDIEHWANGYISVATTKRDDVANGKRIIIGYPDGKFYPENNVTYAELATMLVRIVKKDLTDKMEAEAIWATSWMRWAEEEGILKGLTVTDSNKAVVRKDAFEMIYNAMYKLDKTNRNSVDFGDQIGIVSRLQAGKIELNSDKDKTYKIDYNTMVTDGTTWKSLSENSNREGVGSLVRLIADKDGNVSHIVELGNPRQGAIDYKNNSANGIANGDYRNARWFSVAEYTVGAGFGNNATARVIDGKEIVVNGITAKIDSETRFFVADPDNVHYKEIKDLNEAFNVYKLNSNNLKNVYMGYDKYNKINEAEVIVFHATDKYQGVKALRRITKFENSKYEFAAEDTKGKEEYFNLRGTAVFPAPHLVGYKDVVDIRLGSTSDHLRHEGKNILIDYSEDPVYKVDSVNIARRSLTLKDKDGYKRNYYLPIDAAIFLEGQLKKDAHVQIYPNNIDQTEYRYSSRDHAYGLSNRDFDTKYYVDVVSVVDKDLKGILEKGERTAAVEGWIARASYTAGDINSYTVTIVDKYGRNAKTYQVAIDHNDFIRDYVVTHMHPQGTNVWDLDSNKEGKAPAKIIADLGQKYGGTDYIYRIEYADAVDQDKADTQRAREGLAKYYEALKALRDDDVKGKEKAKEDVNRAIDNNIDPAKRTDYKFVRDLIEEVVKFERAALVNMDDVQKAKIEHVRLVGKLAEVKDGSLNTSFLRSALVNKKAEIDKKEKELAGPVAPQKQAPVLVKEAGGVPGMLETYKVDKKDYKDAVSVSWYDPSGTVLGNKVSIESARIGRLGTAFAYYKVELYDANGNQVFSGNLNF